MAYIDISIVILAFNHEDTILNTLSSIDRQDTNLSVEIIIGEDASVDSTREICKSFRSKQYKTIKLEFSKNNRGMIDNFAHCLKKCEGKYIAICEGDDYWTDPFKLKKQVEFLELNESHVAAFHNVELKDERRLFFRKSLFLKKKCQVDPLSLVNSSSHNGLSQHVVFYLETFLILISQSGFLVYVKGIWH